MAGTTKGGIDNPSQWALPVPFVNEFEMLYSRRFFFAILSHLSHESASQQAA
jgi:hypothetical protein